MTVTASPDRSLIGTVTKSARAEAFFTLATPWSPRYAAKASRGGDASVSAGVAVPAVEALPRLVFLVVVPFCRVVYVLMRHRLEGKNVVMVHVWHSSEDRG